MPVAPDSRGNLPRLSPVSRPASPAREPPGLKCLFISGYAADHISPRSVFAEGAHYHKPFLMKDLAVKIRTVLES